MVTGAQILAIETDPEHRHLELMVPADRVEAVEKAKKDSEIRYLVGNDLDSAEPPKKP